VTDDRFLIDLPMDGFPLMDSDNDHHGTSMPLGAPSTPSPYPGSSCFHEVDGLVCGGEGAASVEKIWRLLSDHEILQFVSCPHNPVPVIVISVIPSSRPDGSGANCPTPACNSGAAWAS